MSEDCYYSEVGFVVFAGEDSSISAMKGLLLMDSSANIIMGLRISSQGCFCHRVVEGVCVYFSLHKHKTEPSFPLMSSA